MEQDYGFTISESIPAQVMSTEYLTSYTFHITRDIPAIDFFENLVIQTDTLGTTKAYVVKYSLHGVTDYFAEHDSYIVDGGKELTPIMYNANDAQAKIQYMGDDDCTIYILMCPYGHPHPASLICIGEGQDVYWTYDSSNCGSGSGNTGDSGSGGDSGTGNSGSDSGGNTGGTPGDEDYDDGLVDPKTCKGCGGVVTVPVPELEELDKDCALILKLQKDTNFKSRMSSLIEPARAWSREKVNVVNENTNPTSTNNYTYVNSEGTPQSPTAEFTLLTNSAGYIHSHYRKLGSVFSAGDLQYLYQLLKNNPTYFDDIFLGLVTASNTAYLLRIENRADFIAFGDKYLADDKKINNFQKNKMYEKYHIHQEASRETNEDGFLKMMSDLNIGISLASSNFDAADTPSPDLFNNWTKLKWDKNSNQKTTSKCN
jgi:hypothetical protein